MRFFCILIFAVQCWAQFQQPLVSQDASGADAVGGPFDEDFDRLVIECMERYKVPGMSIAIVNGTRAYGKGYGFARLPYIPASPSTLYYTGSTTKSFTAAAILKLVEDTAGSKKPITLTTPISNLVDFVLRDEYASRHATLEDLLSHRTGMPRHDLSYGGPNSTLAELVHNLRNLPMTAELRQRFQYCNMMFCTLSHAIETTTGSWLGDVFRDWFWDPLGMNHTFFSLDDAQKAAAEDAHSIVATGYAWDNLTEQFIAEEYTTDAVLSGAGAIISSVMDYALYLRALISKDTRILSEQSYDELRRPQILNAINPGPENPFAFLSYGLGWEAGYFRDHIVYQHNGGLPGFGTLMMYLPEKDAGIALMANSVEGGVLVELIAGMDWLQRLLDVPDDERLDIQKDIDDALRLRERRLQHLTEILYPDAPRNPDDRIPPSLPLAAYAGTYRNEGYGPISLALANTSDISNPHGVIKHDQVLLAHMSNKTWPHELDVEHVNADHFVAWVHRLGADAWTSFDAIKAEFRIDSAGRPDRLGLGYERRWTTARSGLSASIEPTAKRPGRECVRGSGAFGWFACGRWEGKGRGVAPACLLCAPYATQGHGLLDAHVVR